MKNEFIPYEEALALRDLGFDYPTIKIWEHDDNYNILTNADNFVGVLSKTVFCKAPLYQQAFRWFREKYRINCNIQKSCYSGSVVECWFYITDSIETIDEENEHSTYEEAELACLRKLIEIVNQNKDE
jgi:hypothetical protein